MSSLLKFLAYTSINISNEICDFNAKQLFDPEIPIDFPETDNYNEVITISLPALNAEKWQFVRLITYYEIPESIKLNFLGSPPSNIPNSLGGFFPKQLYLEIPTDFPDTINFNGTEAISSSPLNAEWDYYSQQDVNVADSSVPMPNLSFISYMSDTINELFIFHEMWSLWEKIFKDCRLASAR